jgi:hypothetical protein
LIELKGTNPMNELTTHANSLLTLIEQAALNPSFDAAKLALVLDRQEAWASRAALQTYNRAFAKVQSELDSVAATGDNPTFKSKYATLFDLWSVAGPILTRNGFSIRFGRTPNPKEGWMTMNCIVSHEGGHSETHPWDGPYDLSSRAKTSIQTVGSTATYLRRYALMAALNLVIKGDPTDDDGEIARTSYDEHAMESAVERFGRKYRSDIEVAKQSLSTAAELGMEAYTTQLNGIHPRLRDYFSHDPEQMEAWQDKARAADDRAKGGKSEGIDGGSGHQQG